MERRQFGRTDMSVGVLGFGAAEIGFENATQDTVSELLGAALDAGLNVIDTAECYINSEELIGQTVAHRRKDYFLFTKCGHPDNPNTADWRPESLLASIERSLRRLRTDRVDLVQLHTCTEADLRKGDVIAAMQRAKEKGYARYIGYSGDSLAANYAIECGAFDTLQTSVNIADQECIELTLPLARQKQMGVIAKRPVANVAWRHLQKPDVGYHVTYWNRLQKLGYEFAKPGSPDAVAIALRFALAAPGVHTTIVGTKNPDHWRANVAIPELGPLRGDEFDAIRKKWAEVKDDSWTGQT